MVLRKLTDEEVADYVRKQGVVCPFCTTEGEIEGDSIEIDGGYASQEVWCKACGAEWKDLYTLAGVCVTLPDADVQVTDTTEEAA